MADFRGPCPASLVRAYPGSAVEDQAILELQCAEDKVGALPEPESWWTGKALPAAHSRRHSIERETVKATDCKSVASSITPAD